MKILFALLAGLLPRFGFAADADKPAPAPVPMNRCFCVQFQKGIPPYYLGKMVPPTPECEGIKYEPGGKDPWEQGLLSCETLQSCYKGSADHVEKKKTLEAKTAQAKDNLALCCAPPAEKDTDGRCLNKCARDWEGILKVLSSEAEKLEKEAKPAREACIAKFGKAVKKNAGRRSGSGN